MARKADGGRALSVSVVGLSGGERDKGHAGAGKSCLCNRFVRSHADDYSVDHISVLSQTDFGGRVVNNDHFLYWGEVSKSCEEGGDYMFRVIEQTEFIDDASFQPFKGGKMEPYVKRCGATKIASAEKLMYICKNQLGIEKEYEQRVLPDGKLNVDGFICIFDVSVVPSRTLEKQVDFITAVLNNLLKTKKPIVLATTKNDDANEAYVREAEKLVQRKEYRGAIQMVETSAHENVNVDLAFILLAQTVDRCKVRSKIVPYAEAARLRKELMDASTEAFTRLIRAYVTEPRTLWTHACKKLATHKDWVYFVRLFGMDGTQRLFRRHVKRLKDERVARRVARYMDALPEALRELAPDADGDWPTVRQYLRSHPDFDRWFFECGSGDDGTTWADLEPDEPGGDDSRIPFDVLDTSDAETVYRNHVNALQREQRRLEWRKQFRQLLKDTGYVTPGKQLSEVRVLFMGRECFEALSEHECQQIYDAHQRDLVDEAKRNFQELLLEHADLFYHFKSVAPTGTITQDDIKEITDVLRDDFRYKLLDRLDQDRKLMLFRHLGFVHCPMREHCPAYPNCVDAVVERIISARGRQDASGGSDDGRLNVVVVGGGNASVFADELAARIRAECDDDECEVDCRAAREPTAAAPPDFAPHGSFRVYSDAESFERVRESLEKTLLSNLERDERPPFHGLPVVLAFARDPALGDEEAAGLREDGESLADSLQCPFVDASAGGERAVTDALRRLVRGIRRRSGGGPPAPPPRGALPPPPCAIEPDVRIIMCMFCGDPYSVESVLAPLLSQRRCYASAERSLVLETFLGDSKRRVEVIVSSFHGANAFRDELVHGFVLVYSTKRKASLATLDAFSTNIPNLPIQIMAVTDSGGADAFFGDDLSHSLMTEGNATADRLRAHFMTASANARHGAAFYTPFFKEVWEKKPEIEQAFHMEEPCGDSSGRPVPPPRRESYDLDTDARAEGSGDDADPVDDGPSSSERGDAFSFAYDDTTRDGREDGQISTDPWTNNYGQHAFTTGRRHIVAPKSRPKGGAQTLKQPGKLNMKNFVGVEEAIERMTVRSKDPKLEVTSFGHAPLATPENVDLGVEYAQARERAYGHSERDYVYALTHDTAGNKTRPKQRRDKDRPRECRSDTSGGGVNGRLFRAAGYSDTDSEWSSLERRRRAAEIYSKVSRKSTTYKRARKKKTAIPVQPPRVPLQFAPTALPTVVPSSDATGAPSGSDTDSSEGGERERDTNITRLRFQKRPPSLKRRGPIPVGPPFVPETDFSVRLDTADPFGERNSYVIVHDDESGLEVSSPRDDSPLLKGDKVSRKKEKQKSKEDEKREKRRAKDEKPRKAADKERDKKKQKRLKHKGAAGGPDTALPLSIGDYVQSENSTIPLFLEKCVDFIEAEGLDSEGIYRVPGNRAHVDLLFQKFEEDREVDIRDLDVPVNAVATALKDFFSKRLPPLFDDDVIAELEEIAGTRGIKPLSTALEVKTDRSCRLLALRTMLDKLPPSNFRVLEFIFRHFVKVAENSKSNSMDSKNLAICWWPTLLPIEFSDMGRFERMRPYLEDIVQTMIDQYPFLFCGEEAFVMV